MNEVLIGIYGASGFGKEVYPLIKEYISKKNIKAEVCFIDDNDEIDFLSGIKVIPYKSFLEADFSSKQAVVAIANSKVREILVNQLAEDEIKQLNISSQNNVLMDDIEMDEGSLLCPFVTLTSNIKIGKAFHANIYSYVAHDCIIGDFVTFAPRVMCNGNVHIEDHAYIGTGAIIKQGSERKPLIIGKGAVVGMGAVVTKNVAAGEVVIGNPAKPLSRKNLRK
ncbi:acetyltransferase [Colwellia sp. MB3u-70]|uniref:acetyltransferase n=1 Tax=unclassified Colwellia TaxID=196834 RepID=UPI0015F495EF|nr:MULTISPECIES: acetyltransferase [unclassified Colwellia]MBA6291517.1 acetyltransferase [Colwellia sp. MB3u-8]MBA6308967.1 acetyltransferase [Colwellia sp. MB3u-70]